MSGRSALKNGIPPADQQHNRGGLKLFGIFQAFFKRK